MLRQEDINLLMAVRADSPDSVGKFIGKFDLKTEVKDGETIIEYAANKKRWRCLAILLNQDQQDPNDLARYGSALIEAIKADQMDIIELIFKRQKNPAHYRIKKSGQNCIHLAVAKKSNEIITILAQHTEFMQLGLIEKDSLHHTPIHTAALLKRWEAVKIIAQHNKTDATDEMQYYAALKLAAEDNRLDVAACLLRARAPLKVQADGQNECLNLAIQKNNTQMVALFLHHGAKIISSADNHDPIALEDKLHHSALTRGWQLVNHYKDIKPLLPYIGRAYMENPHFKKLPVDIVNSILRMCGFYTDPIVSTTHRLAVIKLKCQTQKFVDEYKDGWRHVRSNMTLAFLAELIGLLSVADQTNDFIIRIHQCIDHFVHEKLAALKPHEFIESRGVGLLKKFGLLGNLVIEEDPAHKDKFRFPSAKL